MILFSYFDVADFRESVLRDPIVGFQSITNYAGIYYKLITSYLLLLLNMTIHRSFLMISNLSDLVCQPDWAYEYQNSFAKHLGPHVMNILDPLLLLVNNERKGEKWGASSSNHYDFQRMQCNEI
jgi:hypothetical protein